MAKTDAEPEIVMPELDSLDIDEITSEEAARMRVAAVFLGEPGATELRRVLDALDALRIEVLRAHAAGRREGIEEAVKVAAHTVLGGRRRMAAVHLIVDRISALLTHPESEETSDG